MLNAQGFDILSYVAPILSMRLDKAQEVAWTTKAKALSTGYTTAAPTAVTYTDLLGWEHSLSVAYRSDSVFVISDSLYKALRGLVDSNARPIIDLDPTNEFVERIHGKPVVVSDTFDTVAATNKMGLFCSADGIKIRDVVPQRLTVYRYLPTFPDQTGYALYANADAGFVAGACSLLVSHA
jgi:HK97 family phage major capsid protein